MFGQLGVRNSIVRVFALLSLFVLLFVAVACGDQPPTATPVAPVATSTVAPVSQAATDTPPAQAAEQPTDTPAAAQPTDTAVANSNPTPVANGTSAAKVKNTPPAGSQEAADAFAQGIAAYNSGDYDTAIKAFSTAIDASPDFQQAYVNRAVSYIAKGDVKSALGDLAKANGLQPKDPYPLFAAGLALYKAGAFSNAAAAFGATIDLSASDPTAYFWRGNTYVQLKDASSALQDYEKVVSLDAGSDMGKAAQNAIDQINGGQEVALADPPQLAVVDGTPPPPAPPAEGPEDAKLVSDLGFRPTKDGFKFENYGADPTRSNLTPDDVRRMFGDQVCGSTANGCILTPEAQAWMDRENTDMSIGHCEGFAALSLALFQKKEDPSKFGAPDTHDLSIDNNTALQREIAYFWVTQSTRPVMVDRIEDKTPAQILDMLIDAFKPGPGAQTTYTMEFFQRGFKGGHAVTPYAVEDRGNGQYAVRIYDNNYPDAERIMLIDRNANTWKYEASQNPSIAPDLYEGDANSHTLFITPTDPRLIKQVCDFCPGGASQGGNKLAAPEQQYNEVSLDGDAHLLITDKQGHRTGFVTNDQFVNEIPGVEIMPVLGGNLYQNSSEPIYRVPTGIEFSLNIESMNPTTNTLSTVTMIGPGYDLSVQDIVLEPNSTDSVNFSADGKGIVYKTDYSDSPDMILGVNGKDADFAFDLAGVDLGNNGQASAQLDTDKGQLVLDAKNNSEVSTYSLTMDRIDDAGEQIFGHDSIQLQPGDTAYLNYEAWKGNGQPLELQVDHGSDGSIDDTIQLTDVH